MNYKEKILTEIIKSDKRKDERIELWELISDSFEGGNVQEVKSKLQNEMEELKSRFEDVFEGLEKLL